MSLSFHSCCPSQNEYRRRTFWGFVFDSSALQKQPNLPTEFIWPHSDLAGNQDELDEPLIDLEGFLKGDEVETAHAAELLRVACLNHGFFQVTNHGVDASLIRAAHEEIDTIFKLPLDKKLSVRRQPAVCLDIPVLMPIGIRLSCLGRRLSHLGTMGITLTQSSLITSNVSWGNIFNQQGLTLGTGPHCDPTSITILHQDEVGGLEVFANNKWQAIRPRLDAFVINIGDTFMVIKIPYNLILFFNSSWHYPMGNTRVAYIEQW
ncbi:hypothetical protein GH714_009086 [Hevea brasiliensis]|uniref:Fe2OG dioxygenase domain-containing protein n=1 Tax=Hevea brasiliensis TaxID=3981 RepID=A0A6A6KSW4_HEVBR|nr:hypothetical protein GH714_009086 [Hevea brasiliensis]